MLIVIPQVLTAAETAEFRACLASAPWQDGRRTAGSLASAVKNNRQLDDACAEARELRQRLLTALAKQPQFIAAALPARIYPPKFNSYGVGEYYGLHVDAALMHLPSGEGQLRSDLSATVFLSPPASYDGGELDIESDFGVQSIKLDAGDMVLYPSSSLHRVNPVTRGQRLASFFWLQSLVADAGQRSLLYDLDQAIQMATPSLTATPAALAAMTRVYHNLLRRWAQM